MKKNRDVEASFLETEDSPEISEIFANYIIRVNYPDFISKKSSLITTSPKNEKKIVKMKCQSLKLIIALKSRKDLLIT